MLKLLRLAIISLISLFFVVWVISLFIPSHVRISRAREINVPVDSLRPLLVDPKSWASWYPKLDSAEAYYENGVLRGVSSQRGGYKKLLIETVSDTAIVTRYIVPDRKPVLSGWNLHYAPQQPGQVTVQWYMDFDLRWYPWEKFASLVFEKTYGPMMEEGLINLQNLGETDHTSQNPVNRGL